MEMKEFCRCLFKILFVIFNVIAATMGLCIVVLGIVALATGKYLAIFDLNWISLPIFLILLGLALMVITGMGFLGALCEIKFILVIYSFVLLACNILLIIGAIAGFVWKGELVNEVHSALKSNINTTVYNSFIDDVQQFEQCCGLENYRDWFNTPWARNHTNVNNMDAVPKSCCKDENNCENGVNGSVLNLDDIYTEGCYSKLVTFIENYLYGFAIVVFMFALFMFIGSVVSWYLVCTTPTSTSKGMCMKEKGYETV